MREEYRLSIVLPAFNEEGNIVKAIGVATRVADRLCADHEGIVVDDGSSDATAALVAERSLPDPRARLVRHPRNLGYGEALHSGFRAARMTLAFFADADTQFALAETERFLPWIGR